VAAGQASGSSSDGTVPAHDGTLGTRCSAPADPHPLQRRTDDRLTVASTVAT